MAMQIWGVEMTSLTLSTVEDLWDFLVYSVAREEWNEPKSSQFSLIYNVYSKYTRGMFMDLNSNEDADVISDYRSHFILHYELAKKEVEEYAGEQYRIALDKKSGDTRFVNLPSEMIVIKWSSQSTSLRLTGDWIQYIAKAYTAHSRSKASQTTANIQMVSGASDFLSGTFGSEPDPLKSLVGAGRFRGSSSVRDDSIKAYNALPFAEEVFALNMLGFIKIINNRDSITLCS